MRLAAGYSNVPRRAQRVAELLGLAVVSLAVPVLAHAQFEPPLGIPAPPFGIDQTHAIYAKRAFDAGNFPYRDAGNGPYSHYVDGGAAGCRDAGNSYGTVAVPRCSIPSRLPAGSVVEVHGGPYTVAIITGEGTVDRPVFIRGPHASAKAVLRDSNRSAITGAYVIAEHLEWVNSRVSLGGEHITLRHSTIRNGRAGALVVMGGFYGVVYRSQIFGNSREDGHGITLLGGTMHNWILENDVHHNAGDAIQFCHACIRSGKGPASVYVGRNELHQDKENAIDIKEAIGPVVISQNRIYGYRPSATSNGDAIRVNDEGRQGEVWIIGNRIFDAQIGIQPQRSTATTYIVGNVINDITGPAIGPGAQFISSNTLYNVGLGIVGGREIDNNVIVDARRAPIRFRDGTCANNLTYRSGPAVDARCARHLTADPLFVNPRVGDFRLQGGSPARNSGHLSRLFEMFRAKYGRSLAVGPGGMASSQKKGWDRGAFESVASATAPAWLHRSSSRP